MASSTVVVGLHGAALNSLLRGANGPVARELQRRGNMILNRAQATAPVQSGKLRSHLRSELTSRGGEINVRVGIFGRSARAVPYLGYVLRGTGSPIRPRRARVLRFVINGRVVYAKAVRGQSANNFLLEALSAGRG
jgi:hypothetical protein